MRGLQFIKHRVNSIEDLQRHSQPDMGCEIDIRSNINHPSKLVVTHDPWTTGPDFEQWLEIFSEKKICGTLIVNTKEDGLEQEIEKLLAYRQIQNYFFLDTTVPSLVKGTLTRKNPNFALRYSAYEPFESALPFAGLANWLWVDCFGGQPVPLPKKTEDLKKFKICLVSPELQGVPNFNPTDFHTWLNYSNAICTKRPDIWRSLIR